MGRSKIKPTEQTLDLFGIPLSQHASQYKRLIKNHTQIILTPDPGECDDISFQHSVLCQTTLPYKNPGDKTVWKKTQGSASLLIQSGKIVNDNKEVIEVGLPYGPRARLILLYINKMAMKNKSREIEVGKNLSAFMNRLNIAKTGRNANTLKEQLYKLKKCTFSLSFKTDLIKGEKDTYIIEDLYNLIGEDPSSGQVIRYDGRSFKDSAIIKLGEYYYNSLVDHAVPLDDRAIAALSHNAFSLDIYCWLAHRLYRINPERPSFVAWKNLYDQFGEGYNRMNNFKLKFRKNLNMVVSVYPKAKITEITNKGFNLYHSPPPVPKRIYPSASMPEPTQKTIGI